jgi:hypothetical protein
LTLRVANQKNAQSALAKTDALAVSFAAGPSRSRVVRGPMLHPRVRPLGRCDDDRRGLELPQRATPPQAREPASDSERE